VPEAIVFATSPGVASKGTTPLVAVVLMAARLVEFHALREMEYARLGRAARRSRRTRRAVL
jgi:hypothetical protein